jgi:tRNA A-37 threonylcarbamoyl transferase component Bud32
VVGDAIFQGGGEPVEPVPVAELKSADLLAAGLRFSGGEYVYRTTGEGVGHGGMGHAFVLGRRLRSAGIDEPESPVVGKVFHAEYLYQLRTDEVTRRDHECVLRNLDAIGLVSHPNLLPIFLSTPIADNHIMVSPRQAGTLLHAVSTGGLPPRQRIELLLQALRGLSALHRVGFIHRDFTVRNVLCDASNQRAFLFDFDLALSLDDIAGESYRDRYQGRIFGSPGYSVAPEVLDTQLMERPIGPQLDIYAVGGAIFSLFTNELPYGPTEDMWSLLLRITDGVVFAGKSRIVYPDAVPRPLRPIIEGCMERDPDRRFGTVEQVIGELERALPALSSGGRDAVPIRRTFAYGDPAARMSAIYASRRDLSISLEVVSDMDAALSRHGYRIQRSMGRVKHHPIFMAAPKQELLAQGQFPDPNVYPKIVTALSLASQPDSKAVVDLWLGTYLPILRAARQGLLTSLYRAVHDEPSNTLLLFSEYVDDARFGPALDEHDLTLEEAFGLAYLTSRQVRRLHSRGLAHANVSAQSLLLKGLRDSRRVLPAMVGIVSPSLDPAAMANDVRKLANLVLSWLRPARIEEAESIYRSRLTDVHRRILATAAGNGGAVSPRGPRSIGPQHGTTVAVDDFIEMVGDGLSAIDFNFGVLRESDGDLDAYALLLVSHALYGRLW